MSEPTTQHPAKKRPYHRSLKGTREHRTGPRDSYDARVALRICERIAEGETLGAICDEEEMPARTTFRSWMVRHEDLRAAYMGARELQAHSLYDEALDLARSLRGGEFATSPAVNAAAKALEHLRWSAAKLNPAQYGEKQNSAGVMELHIHTSLNLGPTGKEYGPAPGENLYHLKATLLPTNEHAATNANDAGAGQIATTVKFEEGRPLDTPVSRDGE